MFLLAATDILSIPGFAEPFSCFSHLFTAPVFVVLGFMLVQRGVPHRYRAVPLAIFAFSVVFMLCMSGVYHLLDPDTAGREVLRRLDHAAIFTLIAASFTPIHVILFRGPMRWGILIFVWMLALNAITFKTIYFNEVPEWLSLGMYIGLGWVGLVSGIALMKKFDFQFILPILYGGLAYTLGALLEYFKWPVVIPRVVGPHEMFHLAVLVGVTFHFQFAWRISRDVPDPRFDGGAELY